MEILFPQLVAAHKIYLSKNDCVMKLDLDGNGTHDDAGGTQLIFYPQANTYYPRANVQYTG